MRLFASIAIGLILSGCTTSHPTPFNGIAPITPVRSVERFLQVTNERDLHAMAGIFGDETGPVIDTGSPVGCAFKTVGSWIGLGDKCTTLQQVELEMDLIAEILSHDTYRIGPESEVPGRKHPTSRVAVDLTIQGRDYREVPFVVVRSSDGRWRIEEIDLQRVTGM